jgi:hypothetical protein
MAKVMSVPRANDTRIMGQFGQDVDTRVVETSTAMQLRLKEQTHVVKERNVRADASCREATSYCT